MLIPFISAQFYRAELALDGVINLLVWAIVLAAIWAIFTCLVTLPPKAQYILNVVLGAIVAVIAIRFLATFLL